MNEVEVKDAGNPLGEFSHAMKRDWDERARSNAKWFINTLRLEQSDDEFDATYGFPRLRERGDRRTACKGNYAALGKRDHRRAIVSQRSGAFS